MNGRVVFGEGRAFARRLAATALSAGVLALGGVMPAHASSPCAESGIVAGPSEIGVNDLGLTSDCSFAATKDGGFAAAGDWRVTVERDGRTSTFESNGTTPACESHVFQSGDLVTITTTTGFVWYGGEFRVQRPRVRPSDPVPAGTAEFLPGPPSCPL